MFSHEVESSIFIAQVINFKLEFTFVHHWNKAELARCEMSLLNQKYNKNIHWNTFKEYTSLLHTLVGVPLSSMVE